jgi:excinuclease ABC subunit C
MFPERMAAVPLRPGVYLMRDDARQVLYVGKASALRNRLRSYFSSPASLSGKTAEMVGRVADFEYIVTESEQEALLLENSLIKQHKPRFNARLKDDKTYPYIKVDMTDPFPRIYVTRRAADDGSKYFGPFASAGSVRKTLDLLNRLFPYRSCTKAITGTDDRPCLEYHIKRCVAPCTGYASKEQYGQVIGQAVMFLQGNTKQVVSELKDEMFGASDAMQFERAAALRDRLRAIERVYEGQKVVGLSDDDLDAIGIAQGRNEAWIEVFFVRQGNLVGRDNFIMEGTRDDPVAEVVGQFVKQFYDSASHIPRVVLVGAELEDSVVVTDWLSARRGGPVEVAVPQRGPKRRLIEMVRENAAQGLEQLKIKWQADSDLMGAAMAELQEELSLPRLPRRIECYDISHIQGTNMVASMAVFEDGRPKNSHYRRFKIKTVQGNDDFASMREVLSRRFKRLKEVTADRGSPPSMQGRGSDGGSTEAGEHAAASAEPLQPSPLPSPSQGDGTGTLTQGLVRKLERVTPAPADPSSQDSFGEVPDLVLIDGGKGQLSAALEVFLQMGLKDVPLASLAKEQEEIYLPQSPDPVVLPRNSQALFLVQRLRDEAHRFAVTFHRERRQKSSIRSALDLVPGIGPRRKRALIKRFGSVKGIREATVEEVAAVPGMTVKLAAKVREYL